MDSTTGNPILTFDQLLRRRAIDEDQTPLLAYPKSRLGVADYELIPGKLLNRFVDGAVESLLRLGIEPVNEEKVVGIYAPTDLDYLVTIFGLGRLGYTSFLLSPRLPASAVHALLQSTGSSTLFYSSVHRPSIISDSILENIRILPLPTRDQYDNDDIYPPFYRKDVDEEKEHLRRYLMLHSSGSTGLPKPIGYTNKRLLGITAGAQKVTSFQSVPFSHAHGLLTYVQAIFHKKTLYMMNGYVAQTHDSVTAAIKAANPGMVWTVPYVLKLLAEKPDGIEVLKRCEKVSSAGSRCPDDLGDLLVNEGVHLGTQFGSTEIGSVLGSLNRPREDKAWNYLRPPPHVVPFLYMKPVGGHLYELVVLDGHVGKWASNSDDPPNSWYTSDLFEAHPSIPNAWKFVGRSDDRVTLSNGEKVLPLPIEGRIRQHPLVREAVVFGIDRAVPGLLLFRSDHTLNTEDFLSTIWPVVQEVNSHSEGFSQISRDMITVANDDIDIHLTDKSSIKRAQVYKHFKDVIDKMYTQEASEGTLQLEIPELKTWILQAFADIGVYLPDAQADFFGAGVDSLKAIQMRSLIVKSLSLGGNSSRCSSLIVYECGNAESLARKLHEIRTGVVNDQDDIKIMEALIEKYSVRPQSISKNIQKPKSNIVILTGATGSLGSHILAQLIALSSVSKIYCLIRRCEYPFKRLSEALEGRKFYVSLSKVTALSADISETDLGLADSVLEGLKSEATHIIHCAWAVNFTLPVSSLEPHLKGLHNLISLTQSMPREAHFIFCSSVSTAMASPTQSTVLSARVPSLEYASPTGYARSKLVAERIIEAASEAGIHATILRIGQIVPAREIGSQLWNPTEAIPLMIQTAATIGHLPRLADSRDGCTWIEADAVAKAVLEIGGIGSNSTRMTQLVYNIVNPKSFSWNDEFLPALKSAGLVFDTVEYGHWLEKLEEGEKDVSKNPSRKLLSFWKQQSTSEGSRTFETKEAEVISEAMRQSQRAVDGSLIPRILQKWKQHWNKNA
ncbi:hypothetical protein BP6252_08442 [Coleophoma cylindrospora]|uniref:Carrier domain-containing protein n=1 Tax=Coleophoma cylindrospora TaxID=1849047 RepID=A0A3D8R5U3_9HELO|nr:hypothetical protein BP6252_08442 [Coleophoma cylindrospora]